MHSRIRKFVFATSQGNTPCHSRNRIRHACEECRKRKKRCLHDFQHDVSASHLFAAPHTVASPPPGARVVSSPDVPSSNRSKRLKGRSRSEALTCRQAANTRAIRDDARPSSPSSEAADQPSPAPSERAPSAEPANSASEARFVGHLNPEGLFLATTLLGASGTSKFNDRMGFWLPKDSGKRVQPEQRAVDVREHDTSSTIDAPVDAFASLGRAVLPDPQTFISLRAIYLRDIHPIFPILTPDLIPSTASGRQYSTEQVLIQAVCVAVSTNSAARPFLRLRGCQEPLTPEHFANRLSRSIVATVDSTRTIDRVTLIHVFSILSLFSALSTDNSTSAEYCARAVSHLQTLQLHLDASRFRKDDDTVNRIFLCVWTLDRLNVVLHSRPILIHARDVSRDMDAAVTQQKGCFGVLLRICCLLDDVIDLYRPSQHRESSTDFEFPGFEDLVTRAEAEHAPSHLLATTETLYHAIAILSCRFYSLEDPDRSSTSYLRSSLSTSRLVTLLGVNFNPPLSNFPFVPYSVSVALRVYYREFRLGKTSLHRSIAQNQLSAVCSLLEKYGEVFPFARRLAWLALKTVREVDKVTASHSSYDFGPTGETSEHPARAVHDSNAVDNRCEGRDDQAADTHETRNSRHPGAAEITQPTTAFDSVPANPENISDIFEHLPPELNLDVVDDALVHNFGLDTFYDPHQDALMSWLPETIMPDLLSGDGVDVSSSSAA